MELLDLNANIRTLTGKGPGGRLRRSGEIPAVLYGPKTEPVSLAVSSYDFEHLLKKGKSGQMVINLSVQKDGETVARPAMIKELQIHPLTRSFVHVDFYEISMDRKIRVKIPIVTKGKAKGIDLGGMMQVVRREVEVLCLPGEIPNIIEVDVSDLDIGHSIQVRDLTFPANVEITASEMGATVVTVLALKAEKVEEAVAEEAVEAAGAEPAKEGGEAEKKAEKPEKKSEKPEKKSEKK